MFNVKFSLFLGIYPGTLSCIVKLPDEVGVSHTKCIEDTETILQLEKLSAAHWFILLKTFLKDNFLKYSVIVITDQKEPFWSAILTNCLVLRINGTLVDQICMWTPLKFLCYGQYSLS